MKFSDKALDLILEHESLNQPYKWPKGQSGITIGYGEDLGYMSVNEFTDRWQRELSPQAYSKLLSVMGLKGSKAEQVVHSLLGIEISEPVARRIFLTKTLPTWIKRTEKTFTGFDVLPLDVQGALVSLTFNRGERMYEVGEREKKIEARKEMRDVKTCVKNYLETKNKSHLYKMADFIRRMARLWDGIPEIEGIPEEKLRGLVRRRNDEADLIEYAAQSLKEN